MDSTCVSLLLLCATTSLASPQRIQLGGAGARPVATGGLGSPSASPSPSFSQQLSFGQGTQLQPQFQYTAQPQYVQQQPQIQIQQHPQPQQQQQRGRSPHPQPLQLQQGGQGSSTFAPIGSFPVPANRQPLVLRSPQIPTTTASGEDEYDEEEYAEDPQQQQQPILQLRPQPQALRPQPQAPRPVPQRAPVRISQAQPSYQPGPGPQRFIVPQQQQPQPQPQQQQFRRPVQQQQQQQQRQIPVQQAPVQQTYQPRPQQQNLRLGQDSRLADPKDRATPAPIQTLDRYMRTNDDGSTSWGYTNEDGTFKEETLGVDCVVRGKYGYVDPDGVKREYEYQSGNPCDPNKRGQPEEEEEELVVRGRPNNLENQQRLGGLLNARPVQLQQQQQQYRQRQLQIQQ